MPSKKPKMCWDKTLARFYVKWAGKRRWLARDEREARRIYAQQIAAWAQWVAEREAQRYEAFALQPQRAPTIAELFSEFLAAKTVDGVSDYTISFYLNSLRRFLNRWGDYPPDAFQVQNLLSWKKDLDKLGRHPKTITHELNSIRTLFQWGADLQFCSARSLRGCRNPIVPERTTAKGWTKAQLRAIVETLPERVKPWAIVQYAGALRPSEVIRLVGQEGDWLDKGIFELEVSKTTKRWLVLSDWALEWLNRCEPRFTRLDSYRNAFGVQRKRGESSLVISGGPHRLRHTAATHLLRREEERPSVNLILGHVPREQSRKYAPTVWRPLRRLAGRLRANLKGVA
jgi:integrase